jgi:alkylhydroperoxidase/carboxymuconolactone decarboxylase family protein YurZ
MTHTKPSPKGQRMYQRVIGKSDTKPLIGIREHTINHLFAKIWSNADLNVRDRRLVTIALLASQGHRDQLRTHLSGARTTKANGGLSDKELFALMAHVGHYAGWAAGTSGHEALVETIEGRTCCTARDGSASQPISAEPRSHGRRRAQS